MTYGLSPAIRSQAEPIELSESEYRAIARAKDGLIVLIGIEQKFDLQYSFCLMTPAARSDR
jgi:hypothetical protein